MERLELPFHMGSGRSFIPSKGEAPNMRLSFFKQKPKQKSKLYEVVGKVWFGQGIEGPPQHVHGGVSAYVLDEAMGSCCWTNYFSCVAKSLKFSYREMTPIQQDLDVVAKIKSVKGKIVKVESQIYSREKKILYSKAVGEFYRLPKERIEEFAKFDDSGYDYSKIKYVLAKDKRKK